MSFNDERVIALEQALMFALSLNARPGDKWGEVKKAIGLVCAEILSDHQVACDCGKDHSAQDREWMEAVLSVAKDMLKEKREALANGTAQAYNLNTMTPEGNA